MSASDEWTEWHLTPTGWVRGTEKEDFRKIEREPPPDRVKTVVYRQYLSSPFSRMDETHKVEWSSRDNAEITSFEAEFGPAPRNL